MGYYIQRWKIKRFHYVLKNGCAIEKSAMLIAMYSIIAVMIMNTTYKEAADYLGWLGGPKRAPSDGPLGVKAIWIGLMKLYILLAYREYLA